MKIIEVIPSFEPLGGAENFVYNLAVSLTKNSKVYVVSLYDNRNSYIEENLKKNNIEIIYLNKKVGFDFRCCRSFSKLISEINPDIVHIHLNTYITCLWPMLTRKCKFIYTFHTYITEESYGDNKSLSNLLIRYLIKKNFMHVVTISHTVDVSFKKFFGELDSSIIYNGIDTSRYRYNPLKEKKYTFISIGSFNDIKNNLFMIKAVELLLFEGFNLDYVILGSGKNFEECQNYCNERKLNSKIHFMGRVNDVENYLAESKCLLLASHWEGNPLVINEAIASGVWIVANDVGGVKDLIDDSCGYLVEAENLSDFVEKMKKFISNEDEIINETIPNNIYRNRNKVDLDSISKEYYDLMISLIGGK